MPISAAPLPLSTASPCYEPARSHPHTGADHAANGGTAAMAGPHTQLANGGKATMAGPHMQRMSSAGGKTGAGGKATLAAASRANGAKGGTQPRTAAQQD